MEGSAGASNILHDLPERSKVISEKGNAAVLRCAVSTPDEWKSWLETYSCNTKTQWIVLTTKASPGKCNFSRDYVCQHSAYNKGSNSKKNYNCLAKLSIRIKRNTKHTRFRDPYVKKGLLGLIRLRHVHTHATNTVQSLSALRPAPSIRKLFEDYFGLNMSPAVAHHAHVAHLEMIEDDHLERKLADATVNPKRRTIHYWHDNWRRRNPCCTLPRLERDSMTALKQHATTYMEEKLSMVEVSENPFAVCIVTALMQRAHRLPTSGDVVYVDSTPSCNAENHTLIFLMTPCPAGAVPLAVLLTRGVTASDYTAAFDLLKNRSSEPLFGGKQCPEIFATDDCGPLAEALRETWPTATHRLRRFHVPRDSWAWLWDDANDVHRNDRWPLMHELLNLVASSTESSANDRLDAALRSTGAKRNPRWQERLTGLWPTRRKWCNAWRTGGHVADVACEVAIRIFREVTLNRCKAFNAVVMVDFLCQSLESYYVRRLRTFADSARPRLDLFLQVELKRCAYLVGREQIGRNADGAYLVPSETIRAMTYVVEPVAGLCSCPIGQGGRLCKHQVALHKLFEESLVTVLPPPTPEERCRLLDLVDGVAGIESVSASPPIDESTAGADDESLSEPSEKDGTNTIMDEVVRLQRHLHETFGSSETGLDCLRRRMKGIRSRSQWEAFLQSSDDPRPRKVVQRREKENAISVSVRSVGLTRRKATPRYSLREADSSD